jgi:hypothetical protein
MERTVCTQQQSHRHSNYATSSKKMGEMGCQGQLPACVTGMLCLADSRQQLAALPHVELSQHSASPRRLPIRCRRCVPIHHTPAADGGLQNHSALHLLTDNHCCGPTSHYLHCMHHSPHSRCCCVWAAQPLLPGACSVQNALWWHPKNQGRLQHMEGVGSTWATHAAAKAGRDTPER